MHIRLSRYSTVIVVWALLCVALYLMPRHPAWMWVAIGAAVLMISHDLHVVMAASDRVICLNGHICCEGTPRVVSTAPEYRALFGLGTQGALALYRHEHDHAHEDGHPHHPHHDHDHTHEHDHA